MAAELPRTPAGLWEVCWAERLAAGELDLSPIVGRFHDCGTPAELALARRAAGDLDADLGLGFDLDPAVDL